MQKLRILFSGPAALVILLALLPGQAAAQEGTAKGTVRPIVWAQEVEVCAMSNSVPASHCVVPHADGSFEISGLTIPIAPDLPVRCGEGLAEGGSNLVFAPTFRSGLLTQYWDHKLYPQEAGPVEFCYGSVAEGIDADLLEGGRIEGTAVAEEGGGALADVEACAISAFTPTTKSCDETNLAGRYELIGLMPGRYTVGFWGRGSSAAYASWYYSGATSLIGASPVSVSLGGRTSIDPRLYEGSRIEGTVTSSADARPLPATSVCLFSPADVTAGRCTETGTRGEYEFEGVSGGRWQVGFGIGPAEILGAGSSPDIDGFVPQYYRGATSRSDAQTLTLAGAQVLVDVDAALKPISQARAAPSSPFVSALISPSSVSVLPIKRKSKACKHRVAKRRHKGVMKCAKKKREVRRRHGHS